MNHSLLLIIFSLTSLALAEGPTVAPAPTAAHNAAAAARQNAPTPVKPITPMFGLDLAGQRYFGNSPEMKKAFEKALTLEQKNRVASHIKSTSYGFTYGVQTEDNKTKAFYLLTGLGEEEVTLGIRRYSFKEQELAKYLLRSTEGATIRELLIMKDLKDKDADRNPFMIAIQVYDDKGQLVKQFKPELPGVPAHYRLMDAIREANQEKYDEIFNALEHSRKKAEELKIQQEFTEAWKKF